jgi:hypothetical protein
MKRWVTIVLPSLLLLMIFTFVSAKFFVPQIISNVKQAYTSILTADNNYDNKVFSSYSNSVNGRLNNSTISRQFIKQNSTGSMFLPVSYTNDKEISLLVSSNDQALNTVQQSSLLNTNTPHNVSITLSGSNQIQLSDPITLSGSLNDLTLGAGIANKSIKFFSGDAFLGQTHTNEDGSYQVKINKDLIAGNYEITAAFNGAHLLPPTSATMSLEIFPATIQVQTVPAIEGVKFNLDGHTFTSGSDGVATVQVNQVGTYRMDVLIDQYSNPAQQVEFGRWTTETYQPFRMVQVPNNHIIQVGLNVFHKVQFNFVDLSGFPVDPSRITSISIRSIQGDVFLLKPGDTPWLPAIRTARRQTGLEQTDLLYSVDSVTIDGSNVVNAAQQRFFAQADDTWDISLLLYSMHISVKDAFLKSPVGSSIDVLLPNNQTVNYPLNESGVLELHGLARGIYRVKLVGVSGLGTSTPVALSRDQVVNLKILTKLDIILFMSASATFAVGLIFYGRPWLLNFILKKRRFSVHSWSRDFGA